MINSFAGYLFNVYFFLLLQVNIKLLYYNSWPATVSTYMYQSAWKTMIKIYFWFLWLSECDHDSNMDSYLSNMVFTIYLVKESW